MVTFSMKQISGQVRGAEYYAIYIYIGRDLLGETARKQGTQHIIDIAALRVGLCDKHT